MPRTDDPTISVPSPTASFRSANPEVFGRAQGDLDTVRRLGAVETRAEAIKQRFYDHFERHEDAWVAAEALKLAAKRSYPTLQHPAPRGFGPGPGRGADVAELMTTKARQNVHARAIKRVTAVNSIKANLQNALVRNRPQQRRDQDRERQPANDLQQKNKQRQGSPQQ